LIRQWLRVADRRERAALALDEEFAECRGQRGPLGVEAYVTRPERARTGAGALRFLVNGRPIRDRALAVAVAQSYGSVLERGRYPRGVVYLDLPPQLVDFNVHPQKLEVRFADPRAVSDALYQVLASQLGRGFSKPTPMRRAEPVAPPDTPELGSEPVEREAPAAAPPQADPLPPRLESPRAAWSRAQRPELNVPETSGVSAFVARFAEAAAPPSAAPAASVPTAARDALEPERLERPGSGEHVEWAALEFIAQVRQMFLICEGPAGLYIIDQHAAAERVTFDRIRREYQARRVTSQTLLFPVEVQLGAEEAEFVEANAAELAALGMDLRLRGTQWVSIHAVPRLLERVSPERLLRDLLAETMRQGGRDFSGAVDLALATLACHGSLRAGDPVSPAEARALLSALDGADFAGHCPHGRPIVSFTPYSELLRKVGRR
jgi:DNA mismatch repair protein MutL